MALAGTILVSKLSASGQSAPDLTDMLLPVLLAIVAATAGWLVWSRRADHRADRRGVGPAPADTGPRLPEGVSDVLAVLASTAIVVDLSDVTFIDSSAIGGLVSAGQTLADAGGRLAIGPRSDTVRRILEITGLAGTVVAGEPGCMFGGFLEQAYRGATTLTFGGGVNEIQRDIIAMAGLLLPRNRR